MANAAKWVFAIIVLGPVFFMGAVVLGTLFSMATGY